MKQFFWIAALICSLCACEDSDKSVPVSSITKIVCESPLDESFEKDHTSFWKTQCDEWKDWRLEMAEEMCKDDVQIFCDALAYSDCDRYKDSLDEVEKCRASGLTYVHKMTFVIDMESAKKDANSYSNWESSNCWQDEPAGKGVASVRVTPEYIFLNLVENDEDFIPDITIKINRQTLQVGLESSKNPGTCRIEDVSVNNQL